MASDDSFIREVNEDLRSDQMRAIWRRFGMVIIAIAALVVVGVAGYRGYVYWRESVASASGDRFLEALNLANAGRTEEAMAALKALESDGHGAYPALARMRAATLLSADGKAGEAVAAFREIGRDTSVPQPLRDVARIRAAYLLVDTGSYDEVKAEAEPLSGADNTMRHSAREALGLAAWKAGAMEEARGWFEMITGDTRTPANVMGRANMLLDLINAGSTLPGA